MNTRRRNLAALLAGIVIAIVRCSAPASAATIIATPGNYASYLSTLQPDDTLYLTAGTYTQGLTLNNVNGTGANPIVITGDTTAFVSVLQGRSCCNTVSITKCSYLVIQHFKIDGLNLAVDAVKAEGTAGNWAHHITIANNMIVNHGVDQQIVGISTKCSAWGWVIRGNTIIGAGTGLYLGNSTGEAPFVGGLIERNLVLNTVGYNMEIKQQLDTVRDNFPGTANDSQVTIIRYNVWSKDSNASTGGNARPCVLLGAFPSTGFGAHDRYELYGNFFYENPVEALIQITGNTALYCNVFFNRHDPSGIRTVYVTSQNGFSPRSISVFHNTIVSNSSTGGLRLYSPDPAYDQYSYANAVFCAAAPVSGFGHEVNDVLDSYVNAGNDVSNATTVLPGLDLYPRAGQLHGAPTDNTLFHEFTDWDKDFNGNPYDWTYRGAYSGSGVNPGWRLQLGIMPARGSSSGIRDEHAVNDFSGVVYPNPATGRIGVSLTLESRSAITVRVTDLEGRELRRVFHGEAGPGTHTFTTDVTAMSSGFYLVSVTLPGRTITRRIVLAKQRGSL